jgi:hypothetical protein
MPNIKIPLNNFQFGEISPSLISRTDTPLYNNSAEEVRNFWIRAEGGLKRRAGTEYIVTLGDYAYPQMTISFNNSLQYNGGFELNNYFRLKTNDGTVYEFRMVSSNTIPGNADPVPATGEDDKVFFWCIGAGTSTPEGTDNAQVDATAENLAKRINGIGNNFNIPNTIDGSDAINPFTATYSDNTVTITRNQIGQDNLDVYTSNQTAFNTTNFKVLKMPFRIEPFIFSDDEKYIVCFSHETIRFYQIDNDTGRPKIDEEEQYPPIAGANSTYGNDDALFTITGQTWLQNTLTNDKEYLPEMTFAQQGDVMFVAHNTHMIRKITRTSLTTFEVSTFNFDTSRDGNEIYQPYFSFQGLGVTITSSATTGAGASLTTSDDYFETGLVTAEDTLATAIVNGTRYQIKTVGTTDFVTTFGADSNTVGVVFVANADGDASSGTGTVDEVDESEHVDTDLLIGETRCRITAVISATKVTADIKGTLRKQLETDSLETIENSSIIKVTQALHGLATGASIDVERAGSLGGITNTHVNGTHTITVIDENTYEYDCGNTASSTAIGGGSPRVITGAATTEWAEQSYSTLRGYPAAVTFHQGRLWFGGTLAQPDGIWGSKSGQYFNFDIGDAEDDDAIDITANVGQINQIRHLVSNRDLQVFTAGSELYVQAPTTKPITPTNAQIIKQTPFGSSYVRPEAFDGATLFIQNTGNAMREFLFTDAENSYTSVAVSALAPHLIRNPVQQSVIKGSLDRSENYSFIVNEDGTIAVFYSIRSDKKAGWSLWDTKGLFHSLCSVRENLYVISTRHTQGDSTLSRAIHRGASVVLEMFNQSMPFDYSRIMALENQPTSSGDPDILGGYTNMITFGVGGVSLSGTSSARAYREYNGYTSVHAVDGNKYLGEFDIYLESEEPVPSSKPALLLSSAAANLRSVIVGDEFYCKLKTLPIDAQLANGPLTGEPREITRVIVDFENTLSANLKAPLETSTARELTITSTTEYPTEAIPFDGKYEFRTIGYDKDPRVIITQSTPMDLQINGLIVEVAY